MGCELSRIRVTDDKIQLVTCTRQTDWPPIQLAVKEESGH